MVLEAEITALASVRITADEVAALARTQDELEARGCAHAARDAAWTRNVISCHILAAKHARLD